MESHTRLIIEPQHTVQYQADRVIYNLRVVLEGDSSVIQREDGEVGRLVRLVTS